MERNRRSQYQLIQVAADTIGTVMVIDAPSRGQLDQLHGRTPFETTRDDMTKEDGRCGSNAHGQ
jgi:hypothetical protein